MPVRLRNFHTKGLVEAGCDEAGRGCLAGPVVAAAVILPPRFSHPLLNDSKQMTESDRNKLRLVIEKKALAWAVSFVDHEEIDAVNILNASFLAMHRAVDQLQKEPDCLLIDGNRFNPHSRYPHHCIIKGDGKFKNIAAASVLAKTHRDAFMEKLSEEFPHYQWTSNKGYPTRKHRQAILQHGPSPYHRKSFRLLPDQLSLGL
ncbi:MAG: ribonuclease HII [Owenweeksia sp.]|nr:ribonuclease HII [Owenweeksia sp.]MBG00087.1 ribonuclease HII [Owenweeksia sp.]HCQ15339.1 ribonuclease HII [Cryomorphaceae bacterium]